MELTREQALAYIHQHPEIYLRKARVEGYECPICGSGSGPNGTGITTRDDVHFTCWGKGKCFKNADIPDIIAEKEKLKPGSLEALQAAYDTYGINIAGQLLPTGKYHITIAGQEINLGHEQPAAAKPPAVQPEKPQQDYSAYYEECYQRIGETTYPQQERHLTAVTINRFKLGYEPNFKTKEKLEDGSERYVTWKALIIPNGPYSYTVRNTKPGVTIKNRIRDRGIKIPFNLLALEQTEKPVFIVEGELDALSVIEAGGEAVALRGDGPEKLLAAQDKYKITKPLLLALDKDEAGRAAELMLMEGLLAKGISFLQADISGEHKDANEALIQDAAAFVTAVYTAQNAVYAEQKDAAEVKEQQQEAETKEYRKNSAAAYIEQFKGEIAASIDTTYIKTGFKQLDTILDGGLYEGLYLLGAMPSLGKTTLALQIADSIAQQGQDVLIFSLEMARTELMAKSISRLTYMDSLTRVKRAGGNLTEAQLYEEAQQYAKSNRGITSGSRYKHYSPAELEVIKGAIAQYEAFAGNIFIEEGIGDKTAAQMRDTITKHKQAEGKTPVCIIDYTQIMQPEAYGGTDKQNVDVAVRELKRISRDFKNTVIAISSFNRTNYKAAVSYESFKESGGLEYGSDVVMGLQLKGAGGDKFDMDAAKAKEIRKVELKILKNRNGPTGGLISFNYYTVFNCFQET